ncbi:hypothetical protein GGI25_003542 [Coemansia spiralis]|uniref:Uncharacterized protein n=2 Tax=Coemansia TaxID=4863 RepID=A0A9W8KY98_9FUNG|nr:hypothetical protein BX070DRAFT_226621 [Coemansia spiralis]KAJ1990432.1 hypothetical protein EDC05_004076 [Coemansia umbellata]KAJ2622081.1 hypothetical protein GGI26_003523 [Coemansia sp. RSA 1358]KAJ2676507.1 hypothetical protein GGI25_003542 [Coemansia spiralis]
MLSQWHHKSSSSSSGSQHATEDTPDTVIDTLARALDYARTREEKASIQLAAELRRHQLHEQTTFAAAQRGLQTQLYQALEAHERSLETLQRDQAKEKPKRPSLLFMRKSNVDSVEFSQMMVVDAESRVAGLQMELQKAELEYRQSVDRRITEFRLAFVACEKVLQRMGGETQMGYFLESTQPLPQPPLPPADCPFTVTIDDTRQAQQSEVQGHQIPPIQPPTLGDPTARAKALVLGPLRTTVCTALRTVYNLQADIVEGGLGFGADAYLKADHLVLPIAVGAQQESSTLVSAVKRLVQLISTEPRACNAGALVSVDRVVLVNRVVAQVARARPVETSGAAAALVCFVAELVFNPKHRKVLAPPKLY